MKRKKINTAFETVILLLAMAACILFFMALVSMLAACSQDDGEPVSHETTEVENKQTFQLLVDNDQREYIVYVPSSYKTDSEYPLVLHLHGGSGTGEKHYNISGWNEVAETNGFLVAYPTAWAYLKNKNGCNPNIPITGWNDYEMVDEVCDETELRDDVAFMVQMIDKISIDFKIDDSKIYISGFSNGGGMASRLAVEMSDRLAAAASMSGTFKDTAASYVPERHLPVQLMVGTVDDRFAGETNFVDDRLPMDLPTVLEDPFVSNLMNIWVDTFDLDPDYEVTDNEGSEITATYYGNSEDTESLMKFTLLENVGHVFYNPDGETGAAELFWEFFESSSL